MQTILKQPFTNVQLELLKVFSHQLPDDDLADLRKMLALFFADRLVRQADKVWDDNQWGDQDVDRMLNTKN